jgi:AbrB family looped-hinge helix DNA binding protein
MSITIDAAGRLVIPKAIREEFHLVAGSELEISTEAGGIVLKVADSEPRLVSKNGLLVHHGTRVVDLDVAEFIRSGREKVAVAEGEEQ